MMNETKSKKTSMGPAAKAPMNAKRRLLSWGLVLVCVLLALLLTAFIAISAVVMESHTYKRAARHEAYLAGVEKAAADIMKEAAKEEGLSKTMLMKHVQREGIRKLAKQNASDAALVLKGSQVIYGQSFDAASLETDFYQFYAQRLPEAAAEEETAESPDNAGFFQKTEEDPEREALREECGLLAAEISAKIDTAIRVIDMEQVVYEGGNETLIDWLRFMGRGGILLPLLLLGIGLLGLYRLTWERGFSTWLAGVSICSGAASLIPAGLMIAGGWLDLSVEPVQLAILYETMLQGILAELIVMAALWFVIGYIAIRAAIGKPVSTKWLRALFARLRPASGESPIDDGPLDTSAADDSTDDSTDDSMDGSSDGSTDGSTDGSMDDSSDSSTDGSRDSRIDSSTDGSMDHAALLQTIKKAAADSTNSLLGRKRRQ